ncbi:50S ribosomal protein L4 [Modestobacter roseus]|uniref:Large ribosomal subunit protein uL4 n=1 Tax=Modestobacter roseus TaxID=1181884 RepID=A0A562ITM5_9ACTN|nr:50S ribosomal protein L4 [Modestobacter roseus]MQA33678.1 50S ribosomal protein L4 [Modestobacter roseus]TWH74371.1 LSU ribosomal protein L4P [Modestobacter roseus]
MTSSTSERADRQVDVRTPAGDTAGSVTLPGALFDAPANVSLLHQVVVAQLAAARQGTHATKTRAQVSGTGAKPYRQKGTGRARQGSLRSPQFAGGGIAHGPQPRNYEQKTPKKMKAAALRGALSDRAREDRVHVVSAFVEGDAPSTKAALKVLDAVTTAKRVLVVLDRDDVLNWISLRNVPRVHLIEAGQLNTYDVLVSDEVVFTETALAEYVSGPARGGRSVELPDLTTPDVPGAIPSIAGTGTTDLDLGETPAEAAPVKKAAAKKAPAKKAAAKADAAPATAAEAAAAPAEQAEVANAGADATAPTEDGTTDASTEEKA